MFLFTANYENSKLTNGMFYSGNHWQAKWSAIKNEDFKIASADSLTYLNEGYESLAFEFPDKNGSVVSFEQSKFLGKVTIVQVIGTWCPNCMDETRYFADLYQRYHNQGLEIVALCFENLESRFAVGWAGCQSGHDTRHTTQTSCPHLVRE